MIDYGELFCEAVDTIVQERLTHVSFDKTILCTIVDDTNRSRGLYTVTENDNIKFEAYSSDTSYRKGNNVYVQNPGGDWNQQKIIISKKTTDTIEPYTYQEPLSHLVDITGNIVNGNPSAGLIANAKTDEVVINPYKDEYQCITLWSYSGNDYAGYTRLGIQAQFQSWLNPFHLFKKENEVSEEEARKVTKRVYTGRTNQQQQD